MIIQFIKKWWHLLLLLSISATLIFFSGAMAGSIYSKRHYDHESQQRRVILEQCLSNNDKLQEKLPK